MSSTLMRFAYRYAPGFHCPNHDHLVSMLIMMVGGAYEERFGLGHEQGFTPGSLIYMPQGEEHAHTASARGATLIGIGVKPDYFEDDLHGLYPRESVRMDQIAGIQAAIGLFGSCLADDESAPIELDAWLAETLASLAGMDREERGTPPWLILARDILHDRHDESFSLGEVATEIGIDRAHLARSFRRRYGESLGSYLRKVRLEKALRSLLTQNERVGDAAFQAGFYDQSHFAHEFSRTFNSPVSRYRDRFRAMLVHSGPATESAS